MSTCVIQLIEFVFMSGMFMNAILFIPQALKIYKTKQVHDLSLTTFVGFNVVQVFAVLHGYIHEDYMLMIGFMLSLFTSGVVTILVFLYR